MFLLYPNVMERDSQDADVMAIVLLVDFRIDHIFLSKLCCQLTVPQSVTMTAKAAENCAHVSIRRCPVNSFELVALRQFLAFLQVFHCHMKFSNLAENTRHLVVDINLIWNQMPRIRALLTEFLQPLEDWHRFVHFTAFQSLDSNN
jgi:hypothetical protein